MIGLRFFFLTGFKCLTSIWIIIPIYGSTVLLKSAKFQIFFLALFARLGSPIIAEKPSFDQSFISLISSLLSIKGISFNFNLQNAYAIYIW